MTATIYLLTVLYIAYVLPHLNSDVLEKRLAAFEGGVAALAVSSGQSATAIAIQNLAWGIGTPECHRSM